MPRRFLCLVLLATLALPVVDALAATKPKPVPPRTVVSGYYGFGVAGRPGLTWNGGPNPGTILGTGDGGLSAVQIPLRHSDVRISAVVADKSAQVAGGGFYFIDGSGETIGNVRPFCGRIPSTPIPSHAAAARIYLDFTVCPGPMTAGSITATLTQKQPNR